MSYPVNSMNPGDACTIGLSGAVALVMQKAFLAYFDTPAWEQSIDSALAITICTIFTTFSGNWISKLILVSVSSDSDPNILPLLSETVSACLLFTTTLSLSFSDCKCSTCSRRRSSSSLFLHLVLRARTLFRSLIIRFKSFKNVKKLSAFVSIKIL